jgi:hypothetical protein
VSAPVPVPTRAPGRRAAAALVAALALALATPRAASAQQLEPRAYSPSPVGANFVGAGYAQSRGNVLFDPSLPFSDVSMRMNVTSAFYLRTFGVLGRQASAGLTVPYAWGTVEGNVSESYRRADRTGLSDLVVRLAVNLVGNPALAPREFAKRRQGTTLGASLVVTAPSGQYDPSKLVNLGTNRWAFKPELGVCQPIGRWWLEGYAGAWLYSDNPEFFGGHLREQDPIGVAQGHVVYTVRPRMWLALDGTWYWGGQTRLDGVRKADRQSNSRAGATVAVPVGRSHSLKAAYARGVTARVDSKLDTFAVLWQYFWF